MIFIAEIGMNHNGNLDLCAELIRKAKWSGADIVKFQLGWRANKDEINHITPEALKKITEICDYYEIEFIWIIYILIFGTLHLFIYEEHIYLHHI